MRSRAPAALLVALLAMAAMNADSLAPERAAAGQSVGPRCVPSQLNRSAVLPGTSLAVSPLPDSYDASARTQISMLGVPGTRLSHVSVTGARSGRHSGSLRGYSQGDGASFMPSRPFDPGESVFVRGRVQSGSRATSFAFRFAVAAQDTALEVPAQSARTYRDPNEMQHFHSQPGLLPPVVKVNARSPLSAPGYIFASPYSGPGPSGLMIFDDSGSLIWFHPLAAGTEGTNLQVQALGSSSVLTWWQGYITAQGFGEGEEMIADSTYRQVGRVHAGNGYKADLHDFHITDQGTATLTVLDPIYCDVSFVGGPHDGAVTDAIFQEIDLRTGLVRREWHSLDHVALADSYSTAHTTSVRWPFDYFHINSVDQHPDGTTLISARNTWALYELDTASGRVLGRLGGRHSDVHLSRGAATAFQHDAVALPGATISVFDNGAVPKVHSQSRGILLALNPSTNTASIKAQYLHPHPLVSGSQGNMQLLPNQDAFIGWGSSPYFSEFSPSGTLLFDARMVGSYESYRAYRFPWTGAPAEAPAIAAAGPGGKPPSTHKPSTVYASWNGDTRTASWRLLAGPSPQRLTTVTGAPRAGFETALRARAPAAYVAVEALDASGAVLGVSRVLHL